MINSLIFKNLFFSYSFYGRMLLEAEHVMHSWLQRITNSRWRVGDKELDLERVVLLELCLRRGPPS